MEARDNRIVNRAARMKLALTLLAFLSSSPAFAETALQVQSWCRALSNTRVLADGRIAIGTTFNDGFCWGAFAALQGLSRMMESETAHTLGICAPPESTRLVFIKVFVRFADQNPQVLNRNFEEVAMSALAKAFPCS